MTHEEAIEIVDELISLYHNQLDSRELQALNYILNQSKQCEVYDKPVEMIVSNDEFFDLSHKRNIKGRFLKSYIGKDFSRWLFAKPIKKKPLSFTEYAEHTGITLQDFGNDVIETCYRTYQNYLNQFKNK